MSEIVSPAILPAPEPPVNPETAAFWSATGEGRLLIKRCGDCDQPHWYPRQICPFCHSNETRWEQACGYGAIYTYSVCRRGRDSWKDAAPYVLAYVELDEGPRVMTNIVDCDLEEIAIGDRVEVVFHAADGGYAIPRFRPLVPTTRR